ncbi:Mur ligase [Microbulbifer marinus]|nr:Mur ligase [Microbulbifer marinus]
MQTRPAVEEELFALAPPYTLFISICDGKRRAKVRHATADDFSTAWRSAASMARRAAKDAKMNVCWLRVDWVTGIEETTWREIKRKLKTLTSSFFRQGIALDPDLRSAFLEQEINANAMFYGGKKVEHAVLNEKKFMAYVRRRYRNHPEVDFSDDKPVYVLSTKGVFTEGSGTPVPLHGSGRHAGRRRIKEFDEKIAARLIVTSSQYLARQVRASGQFRYGRHACFDRNINHYNALRHVGSLYAMLEAWELTGDQRLKDAIDRALEYLTREIIKPVTLPSGKEVSYVVDGDEIKLGGNSICVLMLAKYVSLTGSKKYDDLMESISLGIDYLQDPETGKFVHVLRYPDLSLKDEFRIIYFDGEAAFGLMRLYGIRKDPRWLSIVEKAFTYFISAEHWRAHDHWLSYCATEMILYRPEERYYDFGLKNATDYLDAMEGRIPAVPTQFELMMAAEKLVYRLQRDKNHAHLLEKFDLERFYDGLHKRAHHLLNSYIWPEFAMYFKRPSSILGAFFIRRHGFRVRIDDVQHYLSGLIGYLYYLLRDRNIKIPDNQVDEDTAAAPQAFDSKAIASARESLKLAHSSPD